jgi:uncharacterized membrane protein YfcA
MIDTAIVVMLLVALGLVLGALIGAYVVHGRDPQERDPSGL